MKLFDLRDFGPIYRESSSRPLQHLTPMWSANPHLTRLGLDQALRSSFSSPSARASITSATLRSGSLVKSSGFEVLRWRCSKSNHFAPPISVMDDDSFDIPLLVEEGDDISGGNASYIWSSSEGEESDADLLVNPNADVELPTRKEHLDTPEASLTVAAHRLATIQKGHRKHRIHGIMINMGLVAFIALFLLFIDWCSWKIVRLPLEPFYLTRPFSIAAVLSAFAGCLYVPIVDSMKIHQILRKKVPIMQSSKRAIPTMGGLFFIPIGITVARGLAGRRSVQVYGAALATLALAGIGLLDDVLNCSRNQNNGLPRWIKLFLEVAVAACFSVWLDSANISTPYSMYTSCNQL